MTPLAEEERQGRRFKRGDSEVRKQSIAKGQQTHSASRMTPLAEEERQGRRVRVKEKPNQK
jgi:hypothetical protein